MQDNAPTVLMIEDEPDMAEVLKMLLERKFSATVEIAEDCASAREKLSSGIFDIITLDHQLPDGDGLELLGETRAMDDPPPVIMVTGHGDEQTAVESFNLGASGYVVKDKRLKTLLLDAVEHALSEIRLKRAEDEIKEKSRFLESLIKQSPIPTFVMDAEGTVVMVNDAFLKAYNVPEEGMVLGRNALTEPANVMQDVTRYFREALAGKTVETPEINFISPYDGVRVVTRSRMFPIFDAGNRVTNIVVVQVDITERKQAEEALRESEGKLSAIVKSALDNMSMMDKDHNIVWANDVARRLFGEELVGGKCYAVYHGRDKPCDPCVVSRTFEDGKVHEHETEVTGADGARMVFWCTANVAARDDEGRPELVVEVSRDITERERAEVELRKSEEKYRLLTENATDVIWTMDMDLNLTYISPSVERVRGYTPKEAMSLTLEETQTPESFKYAMEIMVEELQADKEKDPDRVRTLELEQYCKDGSTIWVSVSSRFLHDENGNITGVLGITKDITDRREAEEELRASREQLRIIIGNVPDVIWTMDLNLKLTYVSPSIEQQTGYTVEEAMSLSPKEFMTSASFESALDRFAKELEMEKETASDPPIPVAFNVEIRRRDGSTYWADFSGGFLRDADDVPRGVLGVIRDITQRKRAEEALVESEEVYRTLVETSPDAVIMSDLEGNITKVSPRTLELYGCDDADDLLGKNSLELIAPEDREQAISNMLKTLEEGVMRNAEYSLLRKDGTCFTGELSASLIRDAAGNPRAFTAIMRDITERKRAQRLVEVQRDLAVKLSGISGFHETLEAAIDAILEATAYDCGGVYALDKESGTLELVYDTGLSCDFVEATSHYDADSPNFQLVQEGEALFINYEDAPIPFDDVRRDEGVEAFGIVPVTDEGTVIGCVNVASHSVIELTEESRVIVEAVAGQIGQAIKRAHLITALAESEERYRLLYEYAGEAIYTFDRNLILTGINRAGCEMGGYDVEELVGKNILELGIMHPDDIERSSVALAAGPFSGKKANGIQVRFVKKDGSVIDVNIFGAPIYKNEQVHEIICIAHDVTERKRAEEKLEKINAELEGYAHTVSHDLKGPLTGIMLGLEMLADTMEGAGTGDAGETSEIVASISRNARNAQRRINELLSLAEAGQEPGETAQVDVGEVVKEVLRERSHEIEEKGIEVNTSPDLGTVTGNPAQVQQVFSNLIGNAVRYNDSENPVIRVSHLGDDEDGAHRYLVRDNGPGIPEEIIDNVFLPFTRGKGSDTGIGLSIVERIVKVYGGEIKACNDNGACLEFTLRDL